MSKAILFDRILQGTNDVILSEQFTESAGAIFSSEDLIAHEVFSLAGRRSLGNSFGAREGTFPG